MIARLLAEPHRFGFFQAVRLLDRWFGRNERGGSRASLSNRLRFRNSLSLSFAPSEIAALKVVPAPPAAADAESPPEGMADASDGTGHGVPAPAGIDHVEITPAFMGLLGVAGTLPTYYTEALAERETFHRDTAARAFLDIFQHRAVALFYEAWRKHRLPVQYESDRREQFMPLVLALAGVGQRGLRERLHGDEGGVADDTLAYFSGAMQQRPVSAATLRQIIGEYFRVPVALEQFVGRWFTLPPGSATALGLANAVLDSSAVCGERVWQRDLRMRLTLGPMPREQFHRFLPGGKGSLALRELLTLMTGVSVEYEVRLALQAPDVQGVQLGGHNHGAHLGWDSFLVTHPQHHDRHDAGYDIHALA